MASVSEQVIEEPQVNKQAEFETPRYQFYETDEKVVLDIFDKAVDAKDAKVEFKPRQFTYENSVTRKKLELCPLKGQIDTEASVFTIRQVKIEVIFKKMAQGRWGQLVGDAPDVLTASTPSPSAPADSTVSSSTPAAVPAQKKPRKNWDEVVSKIADDAQASSSDPNAGGDAVVNDFFQKLYKDADEDTRRAMMKSYTESGGTSLSTNWAEVKKDKMEVKPPQGAEYKRWG